MTHMHLPRGRFQRRTWTALASLVVLVATGFPGGLAHGGDTPETAPSNPYRSVTWANSSDPTETVAGGMNLSSPIEENFASMTPAAQATLMDQVRASGATWVRVAMAMPSDEYTQGNFTWYSDAEVKAALAAGLHVDGLIGWPASWAKNADGSPNMADWATYAEAAAAHYSAMGVTTFEIWNEPNTNGQWVTGVDIPAYAELLKTIYPVIKANDPQDDVMLGGLAWVGTTSNGDSVSPLAFLTAIYNDGAGGYFDSVGFHPYAYPSLPAQSVNSNAWASIPQIHALMADHGDGDKKIWYTEFGAPVASGNGTALDSHQARSYVQAFAIARSWSWSGPIFAYNWIDYSDGSGYFGLHDAAGQARPALAAFTKAITSSFTLRSTNLMPVVRWSSSSPGGSSMSTTSGGSSFSWTIDVTPAEAPYYKGWGEVVDGQSINWAPSSTSPSGSISAAQLGAGNHTVVVCLYFTDGSVQEVLSRTLHVAG